MRMLGSGTIGTLSAIFTVAMLTVAPVRAQEPIKVGVLVVQGGSMAVMGNGAVTAIRLAFEEEGPTIAGRKYQLIVDDDEAKTDVALAKLRKLIEFERSDVLISSLVSNVSLATRDYISAQKVPTLTMGGSSALTRDKKSPNYFRVAPSSFQWGTAAAHFLIDKMKWKKVVLIGSNYLAPREGMAAAAKIFGDAAVVESLWPPAGVIDYAPFLSKLINVQADGAIVAVWNADVLKFIPQYSDYGLDKKIPIFGVASFASEDYLQGMPQQIEGTLSASNYCGTLDSEANKKFVAAYKAKVGAAPGLYQYFSYVSAKLIVSAIKKVGGKVEDREAFTRAIAEARVDGPMGEVHFDENNGLVADMFVMKIQGSAPNRQNICLDRIRGVKDDYSMN